MIIKSMSITINIPWAQSFKDKRMEIRSILARISGSFNVSAAEAGRRDAINTAVIAFVCVAADEARADDILEHIHCFVENRTPVEIASTEYGSYNL